MYAYVVKDASQHRSKNDQHSLTLNTENKPDLNETVKKVTRFLKWIHRTSIQVILKVTLLLQCENERSNVCTRRNNKYVK